MFSVSAHTASTLHIKFYAHYTGSFAGESFGIRDLQLTLSD